MTKEARLYGSSLYELASEEGVSDEMMQQAATLRQVFAENPAYIALLQEPAINFDERMGLLDTAFGEQVHPYLMNFIKLLCERGYMRQFGDCVEAFTQLYDADHDVTRALVTSAVELTSKQKEALQKKLEGISGKQVVMQTQVDPRLIGGIRVEIDGKALDGTLSTRLSGISRSLKEVTL